MSQVRRRFGRFERELAAQITVDGETFDGTTINLGLGGMSLEASTSAPFDATVGFAFEVPTPQQRVEAKGRVMWTRQTSDDRWAIGLAFEALRPIDVWALLQYFNLSSSERSADDEAAVIGGE